MERKWKIRLDRAVTPIYWFGKFGHKSTWSRGFYVWTPLGGLFITGSFRC